MINIFNFSNTKLKKIFFRFIDLTKEQKDLLFSCENGDTKLIKNAILI